MIYSKISVNIHIFQGRHRCLYIEQNRYKHNQQVQRQRMFKQLQPAFIPLLRKRVEPLRRKGLEPLSRKSVEPLRREAIEPLRRETIEPLRRETIEPLRRESAEPLRRETVNPMLTLNVNLSKTNSMIYKYITSIKTDDNAKGVVDIQPLIQENYFRSRYGKFLSDQCHVILIARKQCSNCLTHRRHREREPSRISAKKLCRLFTKSRKLRKVIRNQIKRNIPTSSHIHRYTQAFTHERQRIISNSCFGEFVKTKLNCKTRLTKCNKDTFASRNQFHNLKELYLCQTQKSTYKDINHIVNYCKLNLIGDIEINPGPAKTIHAPYSQENVDVFGQNAGRQCVPMSLCSFNYINYNHSIVDLSDLVNIMHMGNDLYTALSRLSRQTYLLLTELPTMVTVQDIDYSLEFSESYTGDLHLHMSKHSICHAFGTTTARNI